MAKEIFAYLKKRPQSMPNLSFTSVGGDDMEIDEATPIIKSTWKSLMSDKETVGARIYEYILTKEITMSQLFMKTNIQQQSGIFMDMMEKVVGFLDDPTTMDSKLVDMGERHVKDYGIKTKHFKHFKGAFLKAIKKYLPWTDKREHAWLWFWGRIINQMTLATQANHYPLISQFDGKELRREEMIAFAANVHDSFDTALTTDPGAFASAFYNNLLEEEPEIAKLFSAQNTSFELQSTRFISMLNHAIKLLDDTNSFTIKLEALATKHVGYGVKIPMLKSFGDVLLKQVKILNIEYYEKQQNIGGDDEKKDDDESDELSMKLEIMQINKWNKEMDNSWTWFWTVVVGVFSDGMTKEMARVKRESGNNRNRIDKKQLLDIDFSNL